MILIKNMDMPESCRWCPLLSCVGVYPRCVVVDNGYFQNEIPADERAKWCPLIEVPKKRTPDKGVIDEEWWD